ncbi:hypothetical protein [Acinetobacter sp. Leaf130]|uniref:hypothetical protein n=1 Tax=Acinetobacter sp. Leaf130 TaxID=1736269 RepID=UPI0006FCFAE0|nr:hypothetical protein [Acinetobacter sp. Leaf130]KQQ65483.1 hypothetical protein ASF86_18560 [Acinetobacter sp. Leaf130]
MRVFNSDNTVSRLLALIYVFVMCAISFASAIGILASVIGFFLYSFEIQSIFTKWEVEYSLKWWSYFISIIGFTLLGNLSYFLMRFPFGDEFD